MTQKLLIIALILVVIYLAYQQTTQPNLLTTSAQLTHLEQERNHYQTLYQKRVKKDLEHDQTQKIQQLSQNIQHLEHNLAGAREAQTLYQQKATDLETSLLNLAKSKIKNQKEAQGLLNQLETNWKAEQATEKTNLLSKLDNYLEKL